MREGKGLCQKGMKRVEGFRPVGQGEIAAIEILIGGEQIAPRPAPPQRLAGADFLHLAGRDLSIAQRGFGAVEIIAQDEIDHPGHGIPAIDRRGPVGQDFHPVQRRDRDQGQVDEIANLRGRRKPAAIQQDQRAARAEPAQIGTRPIGVVGPGIGIIGQADRGELTGAAPEILRQGPDELVDRGDPAPQDIVMVIDLQGRGFRGEAAQARAGRPFRFQGLPLRPLKQDWTAPARAPPLGSGRAFPPSSSGGSQTRPRVRTWLQALYATGVAPARPPV